MASLRKNLLNRKKGYNKSDVSPVKWSEYFDRQFDVTVDLGSFHVYSKGDNGPVVLCLHGGGYSGLTWSIFAKEIVNLVNCQVLAVDMRGHGKTQVYNDTDLSLEMLARDVVDLLNALYPEGHPTVIIVGHSLGGAVAVEAALNLPCIAGMVVIDVVEGTALESLSAMHNVLRGRPSMFGSINDAIRWCHSSGMVHNLEAARVSVPGQIKNIATGELAATEIERGIPLPEVCESISPRIYHSSTSIIEEDEDVSENLQNKVSEMKPPRIGTPYPSPQSSSISIASTGPIDKNYTWRIDLAKTEQYWNGWFTGLSRKFLSVSAPKVLLMANIHGLDTALTLGQMQGKFQMQVLSKSGHAIHEDQPQHVAEIIGSFLVKQRFTTAKHGFTPVMPAC